MTDISVKINAEPKEKPDEKNIAFGTIFSDHMFLMNYDEGEGWHDGRIVPYAPLQIEPAAMVFHYGQEIFEGLKAYRDDNGDIRLFRPWENIKRMNNSARRMCIPELPESYVLDAMCKLVKLDAGWVPAAEGTSLYIRPFIIATDPSLAVHASKSYLFAIITGPVGSYYPEGINPIKIIIESEDVRTVKGGTGFAKCGGNYAASLRAGERAEKKGYAQVLWLDGVERKYIEEVGSMNIMFKISGQVITPALTGSVLPGITRKSCIELLESWGIETSERLISIDELISACENGAVDEVWGTGTAAVVSAVGEISYEGKSYIINGGKTGSITQRIYDSLTDLQLGRAQDPFGWSLVL